MPEISLDREIQEEKGDRNVNRATELLDMVEGRGKQEFQAMKKMVNDLFKGNKKTKVVIKELPGIGSFILTGDPAAILNLIKIGIGSSAELFGNHGYSAEKKGDKTVLLKNFDLFTNAKWSQIWKK